MLKREENKLMLQFMAACIVVFKSDWTFGNSKGVTGQKLRTLTTTMMQEI